MKIRGTQELGEQCKQVITLLGHNEPDSITKAVGTSTTGRTTKELG